MQEPAVVCVYGPSGAGKTTDCAYAMPRAFFVATPAALKPAMSAVGFQPSSQQVWEAPSIRALTQLLPKLGPEFDGVVVDDFTLLAERSFSLLEKKLSGFKLWGGLRDEVLDFRDACRVHKKHVILNAHESAPRTKDGRFIKGGPKLPSDLPETFPVQCDLVLRTFVEPSRKGAWPVVYRCSPLDSSFTTKDRHSVTPDMSPMNIGEILRAAGYPLRRAPGLEWMDEVVEKIAQYAAQTDPMLHGQLAKQIIQTIHGQFSQNPLHIRWALRDGFDRWTLRVAKAGILNIFTQ